MTQQSVLSEGRKRRKPEATRGEIIAFLDAARAFIASEIKAGYGAPGPRAIYYALRSSLHPGIEKGCEKLVNDRLIAARKRWIAGDRSSYALDPALIEDDYRYTRGDDYHASPSDWLESLPRYRANPWTSQDVRVLVLCEKAGRMGVVEKACTDTRTPFASMGGNHSISFGMVLAAQIADWRKAGLDVRVIYVGDHDPQGLRMDGNIIEALGLRALRHVTRDGTLIGHSNELKRVAITLDQARDLGLPTEDVILSGNRSERTKQQAYIDEHGDEQVEVDALQPSSLLENMITEAVWDEIDPESWNHRVDEMEAEGERVAGAIRGAAAELEASK